jgi:hypothetical protein
MSCCNDERPFVYMITCKGSGGEDGPQMPSAIVRDRTTMLAKTTEDVKKRALYELAQEDAAADPKIVRSPESLEVLVGPFPV